MTFPCIFLLDDFSLYFPISWLFWMGSHWSHWKTKSSLCALAVSNGGGSIISFTWVKLTFPYIFLLDDFSLYFLICWLFWMDSHLHHWTAKSSLCALAVLSGRFNWGGYIISFTWVILTFPYIFLLIDFSLYFPISWLFQMGSHWSHWMAKISLCALAVLNGGSIISFTQ